MTEPIFFDGPAGFRAWLERHHESADEVWVGFHKKATGLQTMSWSEAVDEAICFGWIDSRMQPLEKTTYKQRFTPRKPGSVWSAVNVRKVEALTERGRMRPAGVRAFEARKAERTAIYSFEQEGPVELPPEAVTRFRASRAAWRFFEAQPPSYRKAAIWWVVSAKREETRERRLAKLIEDSGVGRRLKQFAPRGRKA